MALVLLAAGLVEARWTPVDASPWTLDGQSAVLVDVPASESLRVDCAEPVRHVVIDGLLVREQGESAHPGGDGWWYLPPSDHPAHQQVVVGEGCSVERLMETPSAAGFDRLEHAVDLQRLAAVVSASPALSAPHRRWLTQADDEAQWRLRYEALRPARAHQSPGLWAVSPEDGYAVSIDGQRWWESPGTFSSKGSARLLVQVHPRAPGERVCLTVDATTHCQVSSREQRLDALSERRERSDSEVRPMVWRVVVGSGTHRLVLSDVLRARVTRSPAHSTDRRAPGPLRQKPEGILVIGPCGDVPCPPPQRRVANRASLNAALLLRPSHAWPPTGPTWVALEDVSATDGARWQDADGRVRLWVRPGRRCTLTLGDQRFQAEPDEAITRFFLDTRAGLEPPSADCPMWIRLDSPLPETFADRPRYLLAKMSSLASRSIFEVPEGPADLHLEISWPSDSLEPVGVEVIGSTGTRTLLLRPVQLASGASTSSARSWTLPVAVPLGDDVQRLQFGRPVDALIQISAPAVADEEEVPPPSEPSPAETDDPETLLRSLQALSGTRPRDHRARVAILHRLGALQLALEERRLDRFPLPMNIDELLTAGMELRWRSLGGAWVQGEPRPETLHAASRGDFISVARDSGVDPVDRVRAWRRAILGGQILRPEQRIEAYITLLDSVPPALRSLPVWGSIRALSRWETVRLVEGSGAPTWSIAPLSEAERWELRLSDALFPSRWPVDETLVLGSALLSLPSGPAQTIPARCRARKRNIDSTSIAVLDGAGAVLRRTTLPLSGRETALHLPEGGHRYVSSEEPEAAVCQLRLEADLAATLQGRAGWLHRIDPSGAVRFSVLGPTAIRVSGAPGATFSVADGEKSASLVLTEHGTGELPIHEAGPRAIRITSDEPQWLRVDLRRPTAASLSPPSDRSLVLEEEATPTWQAVDREATLAVIPRRRHGVPLTGTVGLALDGEPGADGLEIPRPRLVARAGALSRPSRERLWLGVEAALVLLTKQPLGWARLHTEWAPIRGPWRLGLRASGQLAHGQPDGNAMTTLKGWSTLSIERWIGDRTRFSGFVTAAGRVDASALGRFDYGVHPELWSSWQQDHLATLHYELQSRTAVSRWLWVAAEVTAVHDPLGDGVDRLGSRGWVELSRPGAWLRLGGGSYFWLQDSIRSATRVDPMIEASGWTFLWPSGDLAIQLRGRASWWPSRGIASLVLGPTFYLSRDRGLADLPLSSLAARSAAEWSHDGAALRRGLREAP